MSDLTGWVPQEGSPTDARTVIEVSPSDFAWLLQQLDEPANPNPKLVKLLEDDPDG